MGQLDFQELTQTINYSRTTQIDAEPISGKGKSLSLYRGAYKVHISSYPFRVLYLYSGATQEDLRVASREIDEDLETHVVYPPSLAQRHSPSVDLTRLFRKAKGIWTTKDYLASFISEEILTYKAKLIEQFPQFYIDPKVAVPAGFV